MRARTLCTLSSAAACTVAGLTIALALGAYGPATSPSEVAAILRAAGRPVVQSPARVLEPAAPNDQPDETLTPCEATTRSEGWQTTQARQVRLRALAARLPDVTGRIRRRRVVVEMAALTARLGTDLDATTRVAVEGGLATLQEPRLAWQLRRNLEPREPARRGP